MFDLVNVCDGCGEAHPVGGDRSDWRIVTITREPESCEGEDENEDDSDSRFCHGEDETFDKAFCPTCVAKVEAVVPNFFDEMD